ncbi:MAG: hypothetical protein IT464_10665 [Planctomycetes bacterium]|nr:hypothetical protein [Planctomycetota bacterium]
MFLSPTGDTLFYRRRVDGLDVLYAFQPDTARVEFHAQLAASPTQLRAWPTNSGQLVVCSSWPRNPGGLRLKLYDMARISDLLGRHAGKLNEKLTDVPEISNFTTERAALPVPVFEAVRGEQVVVPGLCPIDGDLQAPALYELDGRNASSRVVPLKFLQQTALPGALYDEPGGARRWLTVGDSNHLFVLDAASHVLVGDIVWPVEQQALARVAFHPTRDEAWVSGLSSVFVYHRETLELLGEITIEDELRWHRGERMVGFIGSVVFSQDGASALVARPLSGDILEFDVNSRRRIGRVPVAVDPLELLFAPAVGRVYMQSLRNGNVSWFPYR